MDDIKIPNNISPKKKNNIYAPKEKLIEEYNKSLEIGKPTDELINLFFKIAKNFIKTFHNVNACDDLACINYAVTECWRKWNKFDPNKTDNIFSFYTTVIANDMMLHYKTINKGKKVNISIESLFANVEHK